MTEIPEHLLKRSRERRAALGLGGGDDGGSGDQGSEGGGDAGAGSGPVEPAEPAAAAPAPAAAVEPAEPEPPRPDPPHVAAAKNRRRIPYWAMSVFALLPVWAFIYMNSVTVPPDTDDALTVGEEVYAACSSCHGAQGGGGTGAQLSDGEVLATFPDPQAMMQWIHLGAEEWVEVGGTDGTYGDPQREGGAHNVEELGQVMPAFEELSAEELAGVVRYVREELSGEEVEDPEAITETYETLAEEAITMAEEGEIIYANTQPSGGEGEGSGDGGGEGGE